MSRRGSVVRRLVVVTTVVGLSTGVLGLAVVRDLDRDAVRRVAEDRELAAADRTAGVVDGRIELLLGQLSLLATRDQLTELGGDVATELQVALGVADELDQLTVVDLSGRAIAAAAADRLVDVDAIARRRDVRLLTAGPRTQVLGEGADRRLEVSVPIGSPPGTPVGLVVGSADLALVAEEVLRPRVGGGRAALVDEDGVTLVDPDRDRVTRGEVRPIDDLPADRPVASVATPTGTALLASSPLRNLDGSVVVELPERMWSDAAGGLRGPARVLLAVVIAIVGAVIVTGQRLLRPLEPLSAAAVRLREGDLAVRVDEGGAGEVADLARGFNQMAAVLETRRDELQAAEREARLSEERLRLVVEGVHDHAIVLLDADGAIRTWNGGARRVTGYDEVEVVGHRITMLNDPDLPTPDPLEAATRTGRGTAEGGYRRPDGTRYWGQLSVTALRRDDGALHGYAAILQDVTDRQVVRDALEEALRRERDAATELRHANQLKNEFLAVAAHEIRTPLSAILGASQLLVEHGTGISREEADDLQQLIWQHASDMRDIVERLLDFTQLQAGRVRLTPRSLDLRAELEYAVSSLGRLLGRHQLVIDAQSTPVRIDQALLRHVVTNLLSNAAKFSPEGSTVTLSGAVTDVDLIVRVEDQGSGIAAEDHERIFELFRQADHEVSTARGTGVGLAIVRRYVELAGGQVEIDSAPGRGSRFTVRIPLGDGPPEQPTPSGRPPQPPASSR